MKTITMLGVAAQLLFAITVTGCTDEGRDADGRSGKSDGEEGEPFVARPTLKNPEVVLAEGLGIDGVPGFKTGAFLRFEYESCATRAFDVRHEEISGFVEQLVFWIEDGGFDCFGPAINRSYELPIVDAGEFARAPSLELSEDTLFILLNSSQLAPQKL